MNTQLENQCREFLTGFLLMFAGRYGKIDSPENRDAIIARMAGYGISPSITAAKRAILELVSEGQIDRTDGLTEEDDRRFADESAQRREEARVAGLRSKGIPTNAAEYRAIPSRQMRLRYLQEKSFKEAVDQLIREGKV